MSKNLTAQPQKGHTPQPRYRGKRRKPSDYVTRREMNGGQMNVPPNPPPIAYQPWMPLTVVFSGSANTSGKQYTVSDIVNKLKIQLDPTGHALSASPVINIKLRSIRAWNVTGRMIALSVDDYSNPQKAVSDVDMLCGLVDTGSTNHVPAVGFELPMTHRHIVLRNGTDASSDKDVVLFHIVNGSSDSIIIYVNIFWKMDGPSKFTSFEDAMLKAVQNIDGKVSSIEESSGGGTSITSEILSVTAEILRAMPPAAQEAQLANALQDLRLIRDPANAVCLENQAPSRHRSESSSSYGSLGVEKITNNDGKPQD